MEPLIPKVQCQLSDGAMESTLSLFRGVTNHASLFDSPMESGFDGCQDNFICSPEV